MSFRPVFLVKTLLLLGFALAMPAAAQLVPLGPPLQVSGGLNVCPEVFVAGDGGFGVAWKRAQDAFSFRCTRGFLEAARFDSEGRLSSSRVSVIAKTGEACVEDFRILQPEGDRGATAVWEWKQGKFGFEGVSATELGKGSYFNDVGGDWIRPLRTGGFVVIQRLLLGDDVMAFVAERFASPGSGKPQRMELTRTTAFLFPPEVAETAGGGLFFVWPEASEGGRLMGRRFDALGQPRGEAFEIARPGGFASVVSNAAGRVAVTWIGAEGNRVLTRIYDEDGEPEGLEAELSVGTASVYQAPAVAMDPEGRLAVFWYRFASTFDNPRKSRIIGRLVSASGEPLGSEVKVTTQAARPVGCQSVATNGKIWMLAWNGWGAQGYGIYVQRFGSQP